MPAAVRTAKHLHLWFWLFVISAVLPLRLDAEEADQLSLTAVKNDMIEELAVVDDFDADSARRWTTRSGSNVTLTTDFGIPLGANGETGAVIEALRQNRSEREGNQNWLRMDFEINADDTWLKGEGLRVVLGVKKTARWWIALNAITDEGDNFQAVLLPENFDGGILGDRLLRFSQFTIKDDPKKKLKPNRIVRIYLTGSATDNVLYLDRISVYSPAKREGGLFFTTSALHHNLFLPGEAAELTFTVDGKIPQGATAFQYELTDYFESVVAEGALNLAEGTKAYTLPCPSLPRGFYEVRAYWAGADGQRLETLSCIQSLGSMPAGMGTFAILASTMEENIARSSALKDKAYLGFHGNFVSPEGGPSVAEMMGCTWGMGYRKWDAYKIEDKKPDSQEMPGWLEKELASPAKPDYLAHILPNRVNIESPKWAEKPDYATQAAPGFANWDDFLAFFRNQIRAEKHLWPHQNPRIYGAAWEINLNMAPHYHQKPTFTPEDVVDVFRRVRELVDKEDPGAWVAGPCFSSIFEDLALHEPLFQAGLLKYIDAIECHAYNAPPPELRDIPAKIRRFNDMVKKYNNGKELPIYCTEVGYRTYYGSTAKYREQAQWMMRLMTICKGEGWRVFMPFWITDYSFDEGWGVLFNLELHKKQWGSNFFAPKPQAPAISAWARSLEGTTPVRDLNFFGSDIWGYVFMTQDNLPVVAAWTVENPIDVRFPAGDTATVTLTDMMGNPYEVTAENGFVTIQLSASPVYLTGLDPALYLPQGGSDVVQLFAGETKSVPVNGAKKISGVKTWGVLSASVAAANELSVQVPVAAPKTPEPVMVTATDGTGANANRVLWLAVSPSVKIGSFDLVLDNGAPAMKMTVENLGKVALPVSAELMAEGERRAAPEEALEPGERREHLFPLPLTGPMDPQRQMAVELTVRAGDARELKEKKKINFLAAHVRGENVDGKLLNHALISGAGSSGKPDEEKLSFEWDEKNLYINIASRDEVFHQTFSDAGIWRQDSLQISFDTHPEESLPYNAFASIFTKKITSLAFALTPKGPVVWRHQTHAEEELKLGDASAEAPSSITRDDAAGITTYALTVPWQSIGMKPEWVKKGKMVGISVLVNDSDGEGTPRRGVEFFGGIMKSKDFEQYGRMSLQ